MSCWFRFSYQ